MRDVLAALARAPRLAGRAVAQVVRRPRDALQTRPGLRRPERRAGRSGRRGRAAEPRSATDADRTSPSCPQSAVEGSPGRTLIALRQDVGEEGRYALVVGDELRTLPADAGAEARAAHPDDMQAALSQFIASAPDEGSGGGGAVAGLLAVVVLVAVAAGGVFLLVSRRRKRAGDGKSEARTPDVNEEFVRLGDGIRAIELDVTLTDNPAAKADYDRAVDAYDRANTHQRKGDEAAADRALDEGLAAIGSAQERLAGRKPR